MVAQLEKAMWDCTGCRRCAVFCPFDLDTGLLVGTGRYAMLQEEIGPEMIAEGRVTSDEVGLAPAFYIEPDVAGFLPNYLLQQARLAGNWVLPGIEPPLLPASQRTLRALGTSGPLWRLLRFPWMRRISRIKFRHPTTSWGVPKPRRTLL